ncbi:MAG: type II toxin-antitoxin system PemK/MazF family toxin [Gemmatimonadota bacterium]
MNPSGGEIWFVDFNLTRGHEQAGTRPALVLSVNRFNHGPAGLLVVLPLTRTDRGIASHVRVDAQPQGLRETSFIMCEMIRSVSKNRLIELVGTADER